MKWKNLYHYLSRMTPSDLNEPVIVFFPFSGREFKGTVLTTLAAAKNNDSKATSSPLVLVVDTSDPKPKHI